MGGGQESYRWECVRDSTVVPLLLLDRSFPMRMAMIQPRGASFEKDTPAPFL